MDLSVQIRAFVDWARTNGGRAKLVELRDKAVLAVQRGDVEVTASSFEGGSAQGARRFNAQMLLETAQLALEEMDGKGHAVTVYTDFAHRIVEA